MTIYHRQKCILHCISIDTEVCIEDVVLEIVSIVKMLEMKLEPYRNLGGFVELVKLVVTAQIGTKQFIIF